MAKETTGLVGLIRKPLAKIITRGILYGLSSGLGLEATQIDNQAGAIGFGVASIVVFIISALIDRWHHAKDTG